MNVNRPGLCEKLQILWECWSGSMCEVWISCKIPMAQWIFICTKLIFYVRATFLPRYFFNNFQKSISFRYILGCKNIIWIFFEPPWKVELPHITSPDIGFRQVRLNQSTIISSLSFPLQKLNHNDVISLFSPSKIKEWWYHPFLFSFKNWSTMMSYLSFHLQKSKQDNTILFFFLKNQSTIM